MRLAEKAGVSSRRIEVWSASSCSWSPLGPAMTPASETRAASSGFGWERPRRLSAKRVRASSYRDTSHTTSPAGVRTRVTGPAARRRS